MTKWPVQKLAQETTQKLLQHHDATDLIKLQYTFSSFSLINKFVVIALITEQLIN